MKTVIFNDIGRTWYRKVAEIYRCVTYPLPYNTAEITGSIPHSKLSLSHDLYNVYVSKVVDMAKAQVNNGILNIAHQWAVANIEPYKIMTVTRNNAFYSDLERWRASDRIYFPGKEKYIITRNTAKDNQEVI